MEDNEKLGRAQEEMLIESTQIVARVLETDEGTTAAMTGMVFRMMDALLAIKNQTEWDGLTDPSAIATKILREFGMLPPEETSIS